MVHCVLKLEENYYNIKCSLLVPLKYHYFFSVNSKHFDAIAPFWQSLKMPLQYTCKLGCFTHIYTRTAISTSSLLWNVFSFISKIHSSKYILKSRDYGLCYFIGGRRFWLRISCHGVYDSKGTGRLITWLCRHREGAEIQLHLILYPAVEVGGWSAPPFSRRTPRKYPLSIVQEDGWTLGPIRGSFSPQRVAIPTTHSRPPTCSSSSDCTVFYFLS
jgi:hypothetical protein